MRKLTIIRPFSHTEVEMEYIIGILLGLMIGFYFGYRQGRKSDGFSESEKAMVRQVLSVLTYGGEDENH